MDTTIAELIENDMIFHTLKADGVDAFCRLNNSVELMLAGIAALNSNSTLFGGKDSTSFKIKAKAMNQRAKQIIKWLMDHQ